MKLLINAHRNGYNTDKCGTTMTVAELISFLSQYEDETPIFLKHDRGYTYGSIKEWDIEEGDDCEDDEDPEDDE